MLIGIAYFATYSYNGISTIAGSVLTKLGATSQLYAMTYTFLIPISMSIGALIGGNYSDRMNSVSVLKYSLILSIISSMLVGFTIDHFSGFFSLILSYVVFYFFIGTTTSTLYGLLMKNTSKEFAALEFSIFMGIVNLSDSNTSYFTGQLILNNSYFKTTIIIGLICLGSVFFLRKIEKNKKVV
jgi:MFS family permease